jgi:SAM-dependent methyltransferase
MPMSEEPLAYTRRTYDQFAERFLERLSDRTVMQDWLDGFAACFPAGGLVLDLGSGPGYDTAELRVRGLRAVSLDFSIGMLLAGTRACPGERVQGDLRSLPFASASVDGAWANASLVHLAPLDALAAMAEIHRVVKPGGHVHISLKRGEGGRWDVGDFGERRWFQFWSPADFDSCLRDAGFDLVGGWFNPTPGAEWLTGRARRQ